MEGATIAPDEKPQAKRSLVRRTETETQEAKAHADEIGKAAKDVANDLGYDVIVHDTDADLPAEVQEDMAAFGDGAVVEAWNDNGVIHLVASRLESSADAVKKVLHEIVGHSGLAALFKGRNNDAWNNMVENLWEGHRADILERCKDYLDVFDVDTQAGRSELVEEWLARLAETKRKPMWWKTVKSRIRQLLRMLPGLHDLAISDAEIEQMLADAATAARKGTGKTGNRYSISNLWTGSAADYDKPSLHYIGTGEGNQAFGWGLYASDKRRVAEYYADGYANATITYNGKEYNNGLPSDWDGITIGSPASIAFEYLFKAKGNKEKAKYFIPINEDNRQEIIDFIDKGDYEYHEKKNLYRQTWFTNRVNDGEANLIDWNGKLTEEQAKSIALDRAKEQARKWGESYNSIKVQEYTEQFLAKINRLSGHGVYKWLTDEYFGWPKKTSEYLFNLGIDGIRYPANSTQDGKDGWNYVSFSDTNMRVDEHIRYSMVKEGTQPLPSGPEPSMASILQRAAKSPIDVNHLHALRLPLIHELAKQLGGNVKAVDRINIMKGTARGVFYEGPERLIKVIRSLVAPHQLGHPIIVDADMVDEQEGAIKEYWKGRGIPEDEIEIIENEVEGEDKKVKIVTIWHDKSQAMLRKTLAHEIGHLIDYNAGETTSHGNVLGTVGGIVKGYLKHVIAEDPKNPIDWKAFEKRKRELHKQAEQAIGPRPADADERKEWRQKVKDEYSRLLADECDSNGMFRVAVIKDELVQNSAWWRGEWGEDDPNYARYREAPTELFADAMSVLLNAPDKFMEQLPETWRMLQNYQSEREDFHKAWQGMMRLMENEDDYADTLMNMAKMGYTADEHTIIQINKEKASFWRAMKRKYVDSFAEVNDASKRMLRSGEAEWDDVPMPAITAAQHQSIKDYYLILAERLAKPLAKAGITDEQIGQYLEYQRIVNDPSINQGHIINPHGLDVHSAELNLEKLHKDLGEEK